MNNQVRSTRSFKLQVMADGARPKVESFGTAEARMDYLTTIGGEELKQLGHNVYRIERLSTTYVLPELAAPPVADPAPAAETLPDEVVPVHAKKKRPTKKAKKPAKKKKK